MPKTTANVTRANADALMIALGYATAAKWSDEVMAKRINSLDKVLENGGRDTALDDPTLNAALETVLTAIGEGESVAIVEEEPEPAKKSAAKPKPAAAKKAAAPAADDWDDVPGGDAGDDAAAQSEEEPMPTKPAKKAAKAAKPAPAKKAAAEKKPATKPAAAKKAPAKETKAAKPAKAPKPKPEEEEEEGESGIAGVRIGVKSRIYVAGRILAKIGVDKGVSDEVAARIDKAYEKGHGRSNPRESRYSLRLAVHAIKGYLDYLAEQEGK